jgi:GT2 family glycosyltransferase
VSKVAVVILNWNGVEFLEKFLPSVTQHSAIAGIVVADNNSTDDSVAFVKETYPSIRVVQLDKNYGFAGGYNKALQQIDAKYYVLLNSDVEVTANWLEPMIAMLENDDSIAACQPKLLDYNNRNLFEYAGGAGGFLDKYGYPFCRGRVFDNLEEDKGQYDEPAEIFWACGASLFIRSELYHSAGGLDEFFFAHMEEIDLCWRLKNLGHRIMACPESVVYHVGGGTLNKINPKKTFLNFRNSLLTLHKNLQPSDRFRILFIRLCLDGAAGAKLLLSGKPHHCWAVMRAHFSFYGNLSQNKAKRIAFTSPNLTGMVKKNILVAHFLKKVKTFDSFVK